MLRLALVLSLLTGCTVSDGGAIDMKWHVTDGGAEVACDVVGAATVKVTVVSTKGGSPISAPFSCNSKAGKIEGLRPGDWTVTLELLSAGGQSFGPPASFTVHINAGKTVALPQEVEFAFAATSHVSAAWVITVNDQPATCADVGGDKVIITSTPTQGGEPFKDTFFCTTGMGTTEVLPAGTYTFTVSIVDAAGYDLVTPGTTAPMVLTKGESKPLGTFELTFDFRSVSFTPSFGGPATEIEVRVSDPQADACLRYPFDGAFEMELRGYTCMQAVWMEPTHPVTIRHIGDGSYLVQVFGYSGGSCYSSDAKPFTVAGADLALGTIQVPFDAAHLCNAAKPAE